MVIEKTIKHPIAQIAVFLWLGFVFAISFMEAWLKFQAPGITVSLGLGIGQLVFGALNIMEWVFAGIVTIDLVFSKQNDFKKNTALFLVAIALLLLQTAWLLPTLDLRAEAIIDGKTLPDSNLHYFYVGFELVKVIVLSIFGWKLYKK